MKLKDCKVGETYVHELLGIRWRVTVVRLIPNTSPKEFVGVLATPKNGVEAGSKVWGLVKELTS